MKDISHPIDLLAYVHRSRGTDLGPPPNTYAESRAVVDEPKVLFPPCEYCGAEYAPGQMGTTHKSDCPTLPQNQAEAGASPADLTPQTMPIRDPRREVPPSLDGMVSIGEARAYFMGHDIKLTESEVLSLKHVLGKAVMRQLEAEAGRVKSAAVKKRKPRVKHDSAFGALGGDAEG